MNGPRLYNPFIIVNGDIDIEERPHDEEYWDVLSVVTRVKYVFLTLWLSNLLNGY